MKYIKRSLMVLIALPLLALLVELVMARIWPRPLNPLEVYGYENIKQFCYPDMTRADIEQLYRESFVNFRYREYMNIGEAKRAGKYCNVTDIGYRQSADEVWPMRSGEFNVWFFGGSTTFGYGVADSETIPARFKAHFEKAHPEMKVNVYNFACAGYQSTAEHIWFERLISTSTVYPQMVIFIDGLNDSMRQGGIMYGERFEPMVSNKLVRIDWSWVNHLAIVRKCKGTVNVFEPQKTRGIQKTVTTNQIGKVLTLYLANINMIEAVCDRLGVIPVFVWQPVPMYEYNLAYHPFGNELRYDVHPFVADIYRRREQLDVGRFKVRNFLDLSHIQTNLNYVLYVDACHYNAGMCDYIASHLVNNMRTQ